MLPAFVPFVSKAGSVRVQILLTGQWKNGRKSDQKEVVLMTHFLYVNSSTIMFSHSDSDWPFLAMIQGLGKIARGKSPCLLRQREGRRMLRQIFEKSSSCSSVFLFFIDLLPVYLFPVKCAYPGTCKAAVDQHRCEQSTIPSIRKSTIARTVF